MKFGTLEDSIYWWCGKVGCDLEEVPGSDVIAYLSPQLEAWSIPASQLSYFTNL